MSVITLDIFSSSPNVVCFLAGWAIYLYRIEPYTGLLMYHIIPSIILIVSNVMILSKLRIARSQRGSMTSGRQNLTTNLVS